MNGPVAVIVTARNAADTIGAAVRSALDQPEVREVVVVDDASTDATGAATRTAAGNDPRLVVLTQPENLGPAAARNLAIAESTAPFIAILDADDLLLQGRFAPLFRQPDWDLIADNILFFNGYKPDGAVLRDLPRDDGESEVLNLAGFVSGNITRKGVRRGELGFLKPVIRRSILPTDRPIYDPGLWLGEDYDLYVRLLLQGARFRLSRNVGYAARVRATSLSARHRTKDLQALLSATLAHVGAAAKHPEALAFMRRHQNQVRKRYLLRAFLDRKAARGYAAALGFALSPPSNLLPIVAGVLSDKVALLGSNPQAEPVCRVLLPARDAPAACAHGKSPEAQAPASSITTQDSI